MADRDPSRSHLCFMSSIKSNKNAGAMNVHEWEPETPPSDWTAESNEQPPVLPEGTPEEESEDEKIEPIPFEPRSVEL